MENEEADTRVRARSDEKMRTRAANARGSAMPRSADAVRTSSWPCGNRLSNASREATRNKNDNSRNVRARIHGRDSRNPRGLIALACPFLSLRPPFSLLPGVRLCRRVNQRHGNDRYRLLIIENEVTLFERSIDVWIEPMRLLKFVLVRSIFCQSYTVRMREYGSNKEHPEIEPRSV